MIAKRNTLEFDEISATIRTRLLGQYWVNVSQMKPSPNQRPINSIGVATLVDAFKIEGVQMWNARNALAGFLGAGDTNDSDAPQMLNDPARILNKDATIFITSGGHRLEAFRQYLVDCPDSDARRAWLVDVYDNCSLFLIAILCSLITVLCSD